LGKPVSCAKKQVDHLTIYTSYDVFLHKQLLLGGHDDCTGIKIFSGIKFFNRNQFLN